MDSFAIVSILGDVQTAYEIEFSPKDAAQLFSVTSVGEFAAAIERCMSEAVAKQTNPTIRS
jgi:acyl carrier protein